jgi:hypothetical protein
VDKLLQANVVCTQEYAGQIHLCYNFSRIMQKTESDMKHEQGNALEEKFGMKRNLRIIGAFAVLGVMALAASCRGFFQNPTITSITIDPPNPNLTIGSTTPLTALGSDNEGDAPVALKGGTTCTGDVVCWSSSSPSVATISTGGLLTGVTAGTTTITAASGTATATTTATVSLANVTSITISPNTNITLDTNTTATGTQCLTAAANPGNIDVTTSVTWQTGTTGIVEVFNGVEPMCVEAQDQTGSTTVYATYVSGTTTITSNMVNVTVQ